METKDYVILYESGNIEEIRATHDEALAFAKEKADHFKLYTKKDYEKEFGKIQPKSNLLDKMNSGGVGKIKQSNDEPESSTDPYKQSIIETIQKLRESGDQVFTQALNIAMKGERKDLNDRFETGDEVRFYMEDLESVNDLNVQKLVALLGNIEETMNSLENINGLNEEDLE